MYSATNRNPSSKSILLFSLSSLYRLYSYSVIGEVDIEIGKVVGVGNMGCKVDRGKEVIFYSYIVGWLGYARGLRLVATLIRLFTCVYIYVCIYIYIYIYIFRSLRSL